jgi:hypothetical protein
MAAPLKTALSDNREVSKVLLRIVFRIVANGLIRALALPEQCVDQTSIDLALI